jgi:hypothetical protein
MRLFNLFKLNLKQITLCMMGFSAAIVFSLSAPAQMIPEYYKLKKYEVKEITYNDPAWNQQVFTQPGLGQDCNVQDNSTFEGPLDQLDIVVDKIINIGKKIWDVVLKGSPVVNTKMETANALPKGLKCWSDLQGWSIPKWKVYQITYTNSLDMTVADFKYRIVYTSGGNYNGVGKYITNATLMPADLNVNWGFDFNAEGKVPSVFNRGTKEAPIAGMQLVLNWSVVSAFQHFETSESFYVGGDGEFVHMDDKGSVVINKH